MNEVIKLSAGVKDCYVTVLREKGNFVVELSSPYSRQMEFDYDQLVELHHHLGGLLTSERNRKFTTGLAHEVGRLKKPKSF